jgi:hypothetical protein
VSRTSTKQRSSRRREPDGAHGKAASSVTKPSSTDPKGKRTRRERKPREQQKPGVYGTWLEHRLKALYQPILDAPLPDDMLKLLRSRKS